MEKKNTAMQCAGAANIVPVDNGKVVMWDENEEERVMLILPGPEAVVETIARLHHALIEQRWPNVPALVKMEAQSPTRTDGAARLKIELENGVVFAVPLMLIDVQQLADLGRSLLSEWPIAGES